MSDATHLRRLRSSAWSVMLRRLRHAHLAEHRALLAKVPHASCPTLAASRLLRQRYAAEASRLYAEELAVLGLPAPGPRRGGRP